MPLRLKPQLTPRENYVSTIVMLAMIFVPWISLIWPPVARRLQVWWIDAAVRTGVIVIAALLVGAALRSSAKFRKAVNLEVFAQTFLRLGLIWIAYGFIVLITGRVPSKIIHERIPRHDAVTYFAIGGALATLSVVGGLVAERRPRMKLSGS
jgi:hypothetical protein